MQRNTRRTASPPSKMIAEGKRGRRFYERLPRTVLNLLQYADGLKAGNKGVEAASAVLETVRVLQQI